MGGEKVLVEGWVIIEYPQKHPIAITTVPMRDKDVPDGKVCAVFVDEKMARTVLAKTKNKNVSLVPCYVTYRTPHEKS